LTTVTLETVKQQHSQKIKKISFHTYFSLSPEVFNPHLIIPTSKAQPSSNSEFVLNSLIILFQLFLFVLVSAEIELIFLPVASVFWI